MFSYLFSLICIVFMCVFFVWFILSFFLIVCLSVTVKWLAVKTASKMTYTVSGGALKLYSIQSLTNVYTFGIAITLWTFCMTVTGYFFLGSPTTDPQQRYAVAVLRWSRGFNYIPSFWLCTPSLAWSNKVSLWIILLCFVNRTLENQIRNLLACVQRIRGYFCNEMHYIKSTFYLLTY